MASSQRTSAKTTSSRPRRRKPFRIIPANASWDVIGNSVLIQQLQRLSSLPLKSHAFLMIGPWGIGKTTIARSFVAALLCKTPADGHGCGDCVSCVLLEQHRHPDVLELESESRELGIDDVRQLITALQHRPSVSSRRAVFIDGADGMTEAAANALLKTLEEPSGNTVLVMTAASISALPSTVVSRCAVFTARTTPIKELTEALVARGVPRAHAASIAVLSDGRPAYAQLLGAHRDVYDEALADVELLIELIEQPLYGRLQSVERIADQLTESRRSTKILDRWASLLRRLMLQAAGLQDRGPFRERLASMARRLTVEQVSQAVDHVARLRSFIRGSGNIRLNLESFSLHLPRP